MSSRPTMCIQKSTLLLNNVKNLQTEETLQTLQVKKGVDMLKLTSNISHTECLYFEYTSPGMQKNKYIWKCHSFCQILIDTSC